ncbi:MAG: hypothetical protein E6Q44_05380 [Flavobacteriales bacterium]|nr:MAG: hypothetical protein E6Q44_05380 [Flavobacteriales bacterium]
MPTSTIAEMLKYANLQMAAEALYDFRAKRTPNQNPGNLSSDEGHFKGAIPTEFLTTGNEHASKFTQTEAEKFAAQWTVVALKH